MRDFLNYNFYRRNRRGPLIDKENSIDIYLGTFYNRILKMFKYEGLPETIPHEILEYYLLSNGSCAITEVDGNLYAFIGSFGGEPDVYYRPTRYIIANPGLRFDKDIQFRNLDGTDTKNMVFMRNDYLWMGLDPIIKKYAYLLSENTITMNIADIMLRIVALLSAQDDKTKEAGENYLKNITEGKLGVISENRIFDGIKLQSPPSNNGSYLTQFIELQQYYLGSLYQEIGLSSQFNMKREAINESEATMNDDTLLPLIESMIQCRKEDIEKINRLYGTEISISFDSSWLENEIERRLNLQILESQVSILTSNNEGGENNEQSNNIDDSDNEDNFESDGRESQSESGDDSGEQTGDASEDSGNIQVDSGDTNINIEISVDGDEEDDRD